MLLVLLMYNHCQKSVCYNEACAPTGLDNERTYTYV